MTTTTRTPDQIMSDFDDAVAGRADIDPREILHEAIADILDTVKSNAYWIFQRNIDDVDQLMAEVDDYVVNHYADD